MKLIPLSQKRKHKNFKLNLFAKVDDEDFELLSQWNWSAEKRKTTFYAVRGFYKKGIPLVRMHRFIIGAEKGQIIDHKRDGLNCQKTNLRVCNKSQNGANMTSSLLGTSKYLGVSFSKHHNKWQARISKNYKGKHLGYFKEEIDAAKKYNEAAIIIHGEFANLNKF